MSVAVLDASALIALIRNEPGGEAVAEIIGDAQIGVVNLAEVVSHFVRNGVPFDQVNAMLKLLPMAVVPADAALAWEAGQLREKTAAAGLSLGDRFCLALAKRAGLPAWTSDKVWNSIENDAGVKVIVIR